MIPFTLWQTAKSENDLLKFRSHIYSWIENNPTIDNRFMNDIMCENFIRNNFSDEVFFVYTSLPLGIMRADMWRIAVIYINGGIYADTDTICHTDIRNLLQDKDIVVCEEHIGSGDVANYFFAAKPNHPVLKTTLDNMVELFKNSFDVNKHLLVQDFGMHSFHLACKSHKLELIPLDEVRQYVKHDCYGTWRESENKFKFTMNNKPITFFTTFNKSGYDLYGQTWIESFMRNVAKKGANIKAKIYTHGFKLNIRHPNIQLIDYDETFPYHEKWKNEFLAKTDKSTYVKNMTIRFSHKGFVINHALHNINDGYAIWLDGDCVMHDEEYDSFPANLLSDSAIACQIEHAGMNHHIESGVLLFDMDSDDVKLFREAFQKNYTINEVLKMSEAYDGFIVYKSLIESNIPYNDLNRDYGVGGIQSCSTLTFLHPEIKKRFTHNIGPGGKSKYDNWDIVKHTDEIFSQMSSAIKISETDNKILSLKRKRATLKTL